VRTSQANKEEEVNNSGLIARLQSRIAKRGTTIRDLESEVDYYKDRIDTYSSVLDAVRCWRTQIRIVRSEIKPLAIDQKLDRDLLNGLYEASSAIVEMLEELNPGLKVMVNGRS